MDLLRLVLSWQGLDGLRRFRLLRCEKFRQVRVSVVNTRISDISSVEKYLTSCVEQGEIFLGADLYIDWSICVMRGVFMRNMEQSYIRKEIGNFLDHWSLIETGIPEAQALGLLALFKHGTYRFNDLNTIPWTEKLKKVVLFITSRHNGADADAIGSYLEYLHGYMGVPMDIKSRDYTCGVLESWTKGETILSQLPQCNDLLAVGIPEIQVAAVEAGYLWPVIGKLNLQERLEYGLVYMRLPLLESITEEEIRGFPDEEITEILSSNFLNPTRALTRRAREILESNCPVSRHQRIKMVLETLCGYYIPTQDESIRELQMSLNFSLGIENTDSRFSAQQVAVYDYGHGSHHNALVWMAKMGLHTSTNHPGSPTPDLTPAAKLWREVYQRIVSFLKDDTITEFDPWA